MVILIFHIVVGLIVPLLFAIWLYKKERKIVIIIFPLAIVVSLLFNIVGFYMGWWLVHPILKINCVTALAYDLGMYPVLGSFLILAIKKLFGFRFLLILIFSFATTFFEWIAVLLEIVEYGQGWNIFWTFISYFVAYFLVYLYYLCVLNKVVKL